MMVKYFPSHKRPKNSPFVPTQKLKRYSKAPHRFPDDSEQQTAIGMTRFLRQEKLDAANKRRDRRSKD